MLFSSTQGGLSIKVAFDSIQNVPTPEGWGWTKDEKTQKPVWIQSLKQLGLAVNLSGVGADQKEDAVPTANA